MTTRTAVLAVDGEPRTLARNPVGGLLWISGGVLAGGVAAYLVVGGRWYLALALLLLVPGFVLLHRYPMVAVTIWLLVAPLVVLTESGAARRVFWLFHRGLPVVALGIVLLSSMVGLRTRRLPRLGWPEAMMAGYLGITLVSVFLTSDQRSATVWLVFDRVFVPMCLYLLVRLLEPDETELRRLLPAVAFVLLSQSLFGILQWAAPALLPPEWLGKVGERTVGSLRSPDIFGATVLFCGLLLLHGGLAGARRAMSRFWSVVLFVLALVMVFMSYSRGTWLAGLVVMAGLLFIYPRFVRRTTLIVTLLVIVLLGSGVFTGQIQMATQRFRSEQSEESALSRLPVVYAAIRMFRAKPVLGWGYENFDRFDREFQSRVGNLVTPEKDHASHNLYLTLLAEQGMVGFVLFLGPALYWLFRSWAYRRRADRSGLVGGNLVGVLWLVLVAVVVVSNFHRMQVPFGFGIWWLSLGLIASVVGRRRPEPASLPADRSRADGAFMATLPADLRPGLRVGRLPAPAGNGAPWHARGPRQNGSGRPRPSAGRGRVGRVAAVLLVPALATLMVALSITVSITRSPPRAEPAPPRTAEPDGATVSRGDPEGHPGPRDAGPPMGMIRVPDVTGGTSLHAHRRLVGAGLRLQRSIPVQGPSGIVIGTGPSPGDAVPRGTAVMIFVGTPSARAQWPVIAERDAEPTGGRV